VATTGSNVTIAPSRSFTDGQYLSLYSFDGRKTGGSPQAGLLSVNGSLYGTTSSYGSGYGTIFKVDGFGRVTLLHGFAGYPDGAYPEAGLVRYKNALYGTTSAGGTHGGGTVFAITTSGAEHIVHSFGKGSDGAQPESSPIEYDGVLYGTTQNGGEKNLGTVYELTPNGDEHVLHSFAGSPSDAGHPTAGLILVNGYFYGVSRSGGKNAAGGAAFKLSPFGESKVIHSFKVEPGDGSNPAGSLAYLNGIFYGTTLHGGDIGRGYGTVFEMNSKGVEGVIHSFGGRNDGAFPEGNLTVVKGALYGTTAGGGTSPKKSNDCISSGARVDSDGYYRCGTIFQLSRLGQEKVLYRFRGHPDGANPEAGLTLVDGVLYGTTDWGGTATYYGTIFRIFPK
jgi:uncharacterized repeat protein (TIGR03803 family)